MAVYTTRPEMKVRLGIKNADSDVLVDRKIAAASRGIEDACGDGTGPRRFDLDVGVSSRVFFPAGRTLLEPDGELLLVDDIGDVTGLVVEVGDGVTWEAVTDYTAEPLNALVKGEPITGLRRTFDRWSTPWVRNRVRVTARWGWPKVPESIKEATEILCERLLKRKDAPLGVLGAAEFGVVPVAQQDPDVMRLIQRYTLANGF